MSSDSDYKVSNARQSKDDEQMDRQYSVSGLHSQMISERLKVVKKFIERDSKVYEICLGNSYLRENMDKSCIYNCCYMNYLSPEILLSKIDQICNLDNKYNYLVMLGVVEYFDNFEKIVELFSKSELSIIISYKCLDIIQNESFPVDINWYRLKQACNSYSRFDLLEIFDRNGYYPSEIRDIKNDDFCDEAVFLLNKKKKVTNISINAKNSIPKVNVYGFKKIVWTLWLQGRDKAPDVVQRCISSWEMLNPEWEVKCLDLTTISQYISLEEILEIDELCITAATFSDIIRIALLHEYGGVWVDATVLCSKPLDDWLPSVVKQGFFAFSFPGKDRIISSWFLAAQPGSELLAAWMGAVVEYWFCRKSTDDYYWLHHLFELIIDDADLLMRWNDVPKLRAKSPHLIQDLGLYSDSIKTIQFVDRTIPVFKLVHAVEVARFKPGTLMYDLLRPFPIINLGGHISSEQKVSSISSLKVSTNNIGDHIQIIASNLLLKRFRLEPEIYVDRDDGLQSNTIEDNGRKSGIILNGWFKNYDAHWPPSDGFIPLFLGFHIRLFQSPSLLSEQAIEYYKKNGPIGCRDPYTRDLLLKNNVEAYLSQCLTLTFPKRIISSTGQDQIYIVSRDKRILDILPEEIASGNFVSHYSVSSTFDENMKLAKKYLIEYKKNAKLIVTTLLHCALPAIAMGIPVVVFYPINEKPEHRSDQERFSGLSLLTRIYHFSEVKDVNWQPSSIDVSSIKLHIIENLSRLIMDRWGINNSPIAMKIAPPEILPMPK